MEAAREVPLESGDLSDAGRDISELRKYIVEMMHSEMEMVESVKHHEANVAIVNAQIERVKELILQEQDRYKTLKSALENDEREIKRIEEEQIVAAAKHKQDLDNVHYHENEIKLLAADYQHMRLAMLSLQRGSAQMTVILQRIGQDEAEMNEEINAPEKNSETLAVSDEQVASVKMLRARKRRIRQYSTELELKASEAHETRIRLEDELEKCADKSAALRLSLQSEEREVEAAQARTDEEVAEIVQETKRLKVKLEAKSKKFRSKIRMEISSLKKRVQFMTRELELETMTNEDVSSFLCERAFFRETAEMRLQEKIDRIKDIQQSIASLTAKISDFDQDDGRFNTDSLQEQLDASRKEADTVAISLKMAQEKLKLADNDRLQLEDEIAAAKADIEGIIKAIAEVDTVSIKNAIADCGKNKAQLIRSITKSNQRNEVLLNEEARQRARNAALAKAYKSLYLRLGKTNQLVSKTSTEIENQERSIQDLDDAIQDGERRRHRKDLQECQANLASRQKQMHQLLKVQEEALRQQYLDKQTVHQQELETWDAKIEALRVSR